MSNSKLFRSISDRYNVYLIFVAFVFILLLCFGKSVLAEDINVTDGNSDFSFNAFIRDSDVVDGTADWDADDEPGNDSGPKNGIVRTFDTVTYPLKVTINAKNGRDLSNIVLRITGKLHDGYKDGRAIGNFVVGSKTTMTDADNGDVTFEQEYTMKSSGNAVMVPVTVEVQGAKPDQLVYPDYLKVAVISVDGKKVDNVSVTFDKLKKIRVSAKVNIGVKGNDGFSNSLGGANRPYKMFNDSISKDDVSVMDKSSFSIMGIPLAGKNSVKGSTLPSGRIYFKLSSKGEVRYDGHRELNHNLDPMTEVPRLFDVTPIGDDIRLVDGTYIKQGTENTLSYSLGSYTNISTVVSGVAYSNKRFLREGYGINAVWDSGVYHITKQYYNGNEIVYEGYVDNYHIGNVFPIYSSGNIYDAASNNLIHRSYGVDEKAFSTQSFMFLDKNLFSYKNKSNPYTIDNNFIFTNKMTIVAYEDDNGNKVSINAVRTNSTSFRNLFGTGIATIIGRFYDSDGWNIGGMGGGGSADGREAVVGPQEVTYKELYKFSARAMGGLKTFVKWNADSFMMDKATALKTDERRFWDGYTDYFGKKHRNDKEHMQNYYGVAKRRDYSLEALDANTMEDYNWYTIDEIDKALADGPISAYIKDIHDDINVGATGGATPIFLKATSSKIGSINEKGSYNVITAEMAFYLDADRSREYYAKHPMGNPTLYDENGNIIQLQSPVGGNVTFDTLGILSAKTSINTKFDKNTYFISENPTVTTKSGIVVDNNSFTPENDTYVYLKHYLPAGLAYKKNSAYFDKKGEKTFVEPKVESLADGTTQLTWDYYISYKDTSIPDLHFGVKVLPFNLPNGVSVSQSIRSVIESNVDFRNEFVRTSSASVTLLKVGQVGVAESIEKDFGEKNSDYTLHLQPYTTIEDEYGVKGLTHVPENGDAYGSNFHGSTWLKNIAVHSDKEIRLYVNQQYVDLKDPNQVDVTKDGWMSYEDAVSSGDLSKTKSIYFVIPGMLSNKDQPLIDLHFGTKDNQFHDIYYNEVITNSNTHYPVSPISNRVSYQIKAQLELALRKIQIYTDLSKNGLPVNVYLNKELIQEAGKDKSFTIGLYRKDTNEKVDSKTFKGSDDVSVIKMKIPASGLSKDTNHVYEARIEGYNSDYVYAIEGKDSVSTEGYTSAEKLISSDDKTLNYKGVIMTEREVGRDMVKYYETIQVPVQKLPKTKTGYGYVLPNYSVKYTNELGYSNTNLLNYHPDLLINDKLMDSTMTAIKKDKYGVLTLDTVDSDVTDGTGRKYVYQLPETSVHKGDGLSYNKQEILKLSENEQREYLDGGRKLYIPVWLNQLGKYDIHFGGEDRIGVNQVQLDVKQYIDVYAYMYQASDSNTVPHDELMLKPELKEVK